MPQYELLKIADEQCEVFILGQTLTSSQGDSGARALGEVHMSVRQDVIEGVCDFAGEVLSYQLAPAIVELNYGEPREDTPGIWAVFEKPKDEKALAERDRILVKELGMPVGETWLYERHGVPVPAAGEKLFEGAPQAAAAAPAPTPPGQPTKEKLPKPKIEAKDGALASVDQLAGNVLEGLTGVTREWLSPVRPFFDRLAALALANQVTDDDFLAALQKAQGHLPELFDVLDTRALQNAFEDAIGTALLDGSASRYEP